MTDTLQTNLSRLAELVTPVWVSKSGNIRALATAKPNEFSIYVRSKTGLAYFCKLIVNSNSTGCSKKNYGSEDK